MKNHFVHLLLAAAIAFSLTGCESAESQLQAEEIPCPVTSASDATEDFIPEASAITQETFDNVLIQQEEAPLSTEQNIEFTKEEDAVPYTDPQETEAEILPEPAESDNLEAETYVSSEEAQLAAANTSAPAIKRPSLHIHSYRKSIVAATCQRSGYTKYTCSCGSTYSDHFTRSRNHIYIAQKTAPTCVDGGYTEYTCKHCGYSYLNSRIAALGHTWGDWVITREPTEREAGIKTRTCSACNKTETVVLDKLPHEHNFVVADRKEATCTEDGYVITKCSCSESKKDVLPAVGHTWVHHHEDEVSHEDIYIVCRCGWSCSADIDYITAFGDHLDSLPIEERYEGHSYHSEARKVVDSPAKDWYECSTCGVQTAQKTDHQHIYTDQVVEPTCTTDGYTIHTCACGDSYKDTPTPATGHTWGDWETTKEPTESSSGIQHRKCAVCGAEDNKDLDKLPHAHSYTSSITQPPSCTEVGVRYYLCSCGSSYSETIPATGHSWSSWETTEEPTVSSYGKAWRKCTVCNQTESKVLDKVQHTHNYTEERVEPTCTSDGYILRTCSCGDSYKQVLEGGHQWTLIQPVYRVREYAICPHCNVYLCELDGTADPVEALRAHCDASGGDWYNHSWANKAESILVTPAKWQCTVCGAEKPWEN